jgi:hypothetical protein
MVLGEHTAHDVLVDLEAEYKRELLSDPSVAETRIPVFHFNDGSDQFWSRSLRTGFPPSFRREEQAVLSLRQCIVKSHEGRGPEYDGRTNKAGAAH